MARDQEKVKACRLRTKAAAAARNKAYHLAHPEEMRARAKRYRAAHLDEVRLRERNYYAANRTHILQREVQYRIRLKSMHAVRHDPDTVYRVVSRAVSSALPRFIRDDVISSMLLAVLEGELLLGNVAARVKDYLGRYNRQYDSFRTLSLDAPMAGTDLRRIDMLEAPAAYDGEDDEEDDSAGPSFPNVRH
ncbi:hypothetical protein ACFX5Q_07365 [Mesorhizobium sp. IMUNJ 23033]|uniref:hypothetical protein n=1 Tax=Mesorhizobium sp. IMUNJ 23033 TaxID=3378039 RepID=UPI0038501126